MDACLRLVLCAVLLFGCLQAVPVSNGVFKLLLTDVKCEPTVNFTSPSDVKDHCNSAAMELIKVELKRGMTVCQDNKNRIEKMLKAIPESLPSNSSDCKWEGEESRKPFTAFVEDIKTLLFKLNSQSAKGSPKP